MVFEEGIIMGRVGFSWEAIVLFPQLLLLFLHIVVAC